MIQLDEVVVITLVVLSIEDVLPILLRRPLDGAQKMGIWDSLDVRKGEGHKPIDDGLLTGDHWHITESRIVEQHGIAVSERIPRVSMARVFVRTLEV